MAKTSSFEVVSENSGFATIRCKNCNGEQQVVKQFIVWTNYYKCPHCRNKIKMNPFSRNYLLYKAIATVIFHWVRYKLRNIRKWVKG